MKVTRRQLRQIINEEFRLVREEEQPVPEDEEIAKRVQDLLVKYRIAGPKGLLRQIDNKDEFEDVIRFIFDQAKLDNRLVGQVAYSIAQDFMEDPEEAGEMSTFNL
tara:strand:+ start:147 stop:464 length:318 start_codon:yes stop_codon:yes gene_type:complete